MANKFLEYYNLPRKAQTHKGDYGKVFVVAGRAGMTGAAMLCAEAALRTGAGLVYIFSPGKLLPIYECSCREPVKIKVGTDEDSFFKEEHIRKVADVILKAGSKGAVIIGPGLGRDKETVAFVRGLISEIQESSMPVILDADGINAFEGRDLPNNLIITPHVAELSRITRYKIEYIENNRQAIAIKTSKQFNAIVVLKGNHSIVSKSDDFYINDTGNPGMATGGSGDVLSGIIAGIIATANSNEESNALFELVCLGVYIHGLCGDIGAERYGERALIAGDLIEVLKEVHLYGK